MTKEKDSELGGIAGGYLDVKLPARDRRRRFGSWKSWRRHWVEVRAAPELGVELVLSSARLGPETGLIRVPSGASVCRTASRSRSHAFVIASSSSSPGCAAPACSEASGDVFLAARSEADSEHWMSVLRAAAGSVGRRAPVDAMPAVPVPIPRGHSHGLSPASVALLRGRRLSRSEGDLLATPLGALGLGVAADLGPEDGLSPGGTRGGRGGRTAPEVSATSTLGRRPLRQPFRLLYGRRRAETLRADVQMPCTDKLSTSPQATSGSALSLLGGKIASGLISAGLGLILSTPGGSEVEDNDNDLEADDDIDSPPVRLGVDRDLDAVSDVLASLALDRRRESAVSVASGIYEEIRDSAETEVTGTAPGTPVVVIDRVYENAAAVAARLGQESHYEPLLFTPGPGLERGSSTPARPDGSPPPLPPRQNLTPISELLTLTRSGGCTAADDSGLSLSRCAAVDVDGYVRMGLVKSIHAAKCHQTAAGSEAEPVYLPMSPIRPYPLANRDKNV